MVLGLAAAPGASAGLGGSTITSGGHRRIVSKVVGLNHGGITRAIGSAAGNTILERQGYLVPDERAYLAAKRRLAERAGLAGPPSGPDALATPSVGEVLDWSGLSDNSATPSDSTGAIGPRRYIEVVNDKVGIFGRDTSTIKSGRLSSLGGGGSPNVTDPQVIWDPGTRRFYYALLDYTKAQTGSGFNLLLFGYSRTSSPSDLTRASWCKYAFALSTAVPDYPKLGDDKHFVLFGTNVFDNAGTGYLGSYTFWASKPGSGKTCLDPSKLRGGDKLMKLPGGAPAWTPVPANQIDTSGTGYVLASDDVGGGGSSTRIVEYAVTRNAKGNAVFSSPTAMTVLTSYAAPPPASQSGATQVLDTLDGRLTNAVSAVAPSSGKVMIWTQQTVAGTAGTSAVLWHQIDAAGATEHATGLLDDGTNFFFNGSISPDRLVDGAVKAYGNSAVLGFDRSSSAETPSIRMWSISPLGNSSDVTVITSSGSEVDFSCSFGGTCRWGDYAGASPDPAASPYANNGVVWLTSMYSSGVLITSAANWLTRNWEAVPDVTAAMTPLRLFQKDTDFSVTWSDVSGSSTFDTQLNAAPDNAGFGGFAPFTTDGASTSTLFSAATSGPAMPGDTYCIEVQPHDGSDVGHGYSNETCTAIPLDDQDLTASSGWSVKSSGSDYEGTLSVSKAKGARLSGPPDAEMKDIDVLVGKCPSCGAIGVYLNGTLLKTISLHSSTSKNEVLVHVATFSSVKTGTVKIKVLSSGSSVKIDGLGLSRV